MEKHERVESAFNTLKKGVREVMQNPEQMKELFKGYGSNRQYNHYSPSNTMILMMETMFRKGKPFQMARGYRQWSKEFNRTVKRGEKAIYILAPKKIKTIHINEETGEEEIEYIHQGFIGVPVFELSQTEGEEIARPTKNKEYRTSQELDVQDFINKLDMPVEFEDMVHMNGYTDGKRIAIGRHNNHLASICTLFHELAHYNLHYNREGEEVNIYEEDTTNLKELEAETISFIVSSCLGIDNDYSMKYIINWNKDNQYLDKEFEDRSYRLLNEALTQVDMFMDCVEIIREEV